MKLNESRSLATPSASLEEASTSDQDSNFVQNINMIECVICLDLQVSILFFKNFYLCLFFNTFYIMLQYGRMCSLLIILYFFQNFHYYTIVSFILFNFSLYSVK